LITKLRLKSNQVRLEGARKKQTTDIHTHTK